MASPRHSLSAHDGCWPETGEFQKLVEATPEFRLLHVVCETTKRGVAPAGIRRIAMSMTQAAQLRHVDITNGGGLQSFRQLIGIELGIMPRAWNGAHIHQLLHTERLKQLNERLDGSRRMPDGVKGERFCWRTGGHAMY